MLWSGGSPIQLLRGRLQSHASKSTAGIGSPPYAIRRFISSTVIHGDSRRPVRTVKNNETSDGTHNGRLPHIWRHLGSDGSESRVRIPVDASVPQQFGRRGHSLQRSVTAQARPWALALGGGGFGQPLAEKKALAEQGRRTLNPILPSAGKRRRLPSRPAADWLESSLQVPSREGERGPAMQGRGTRRRPSEQSTLHESMMKIDLDADSQDKGCVVLLEESMHRGGHARTREAIPTPKPSNRKLGDPTGGHPATIDCTGLVDDGNVVQTARSRHPSITLGRWKE
jgi:hypothetical protein